MTEHELPSNIAEAHDGVIRSIASLEKTRKSISDLSTDVKNRHGLRAKKRTHSRQIASYNKQADRYWLLIEEDAAYDNLREEFFVLTEAVEVAESDLQELIEQFDQSIELSKSVSETSETPKVTVTETPTTTAPTTELSTAASGSKSAATAVPTTATGSSTDTSPVTSTTTVTTPVVQSSGKINAGLNSNAAGFVPTPLPSASVAGNPLASASTSQGNITMIAPTSETSNVDITSSTDIPSQDLSPSDLLPTDIPKLIDNAVKVQLQKMENYRKQHVTFHPNFVSTPNVKNIDRSVEDHPSTSGLRNKLNFDNFEPDTFRAGCTSTGGMGSLPMFEMPTFSGDPGDYPHWIAMLDASILKRPIPVSEKLTRLISLCKGRAHEAVKNCIVYQDREFGMRCALDILYRNFGTKDTLNRAAYEKLRKRTELLGDYQSLSNFELDMCNYQMLMQSQNLQHELDATGTLKMLFQKLPVKLQQDYVAELRLGNSSRECASASTFQKLLDFVRRAAEVANTALGSLTVPNAVGGGAKPRRQNIFHTEEGIHVSNATDARPKKPAFCFFCKRDTHSIANCEAFRSKPVEFRRGFAREQNLCYSCMKKGHGARVCRGGGHCGTCKRRSHHTLLCPDDVTPKQKQPGTTSHVTGNTRDNVLLSSATTTDATAIETVNAVQASGRTRFHVIPVCISAMKDKPETTIYALLDQASSSVLLDPSLLPAIGVQGKPVKRHFTTINGSGEEDCRLVSIRVRGYDCRQYIKIPNALTYRNLPSLEDSIPTQGMVDNYPHLSGITFPDLPIKKVQMIIGVGVVQAHCPFEHRLGPEGSPLGLRTVLGWSIGGPDKKFADFEKDSYPIHLSDVDTSCCFHVGSENVALDDLLRRTYNEEFSEIFSSDKKTNSLEDDEALDIVKSSIKKVDGQYQMALPLRGNYGRLPNNRESAVQHLLQKVPRFKRDRKLFDWYDGEIRRYIQEGRASLVPVAELLDLTLEAWWLKHFHLSRGKPRVVTDCSATYKGHSLNKKLLCGPDLLTSLVDIILGWREFPFAVMADIKSMFHCVGILPEYRRYQRFLWFEDSDFTKPPVDYQFNVVVFGSVCGPFCAGYALRRCGEDNAVNAPDDVTRLLTTSMYMDDFLRSFPTAADGKLAFSKLSELLGTAGMHLTKVFGHSEILKAVPNSDLGQGCCELTSSDEVSTKALGIVWRPETDVLTYSVAVRERPDVTRRIMLSQTHSAYDPTGLISIFLLPAKVLIQTLFARKIGWDQPVPEDIKKSWITWVENLHYLRDVKIPRCLVPYEVSSLTLHVFCDASEIAYGSCAYIRVVHSGGIEVRLCFSKSRVAPLKPMTIPKLELSACVVGTNIAKVVKGSLTSSISRTYFWSDSKPVLQSLDNRTKRFSVFWKHRMQKIRMQSDNSEWRYVPTEINVADLCSRGLMPHQLDKAAVWFGGPEFLRKEPSNWPQNTFASINCDDEVYLPKKELIFSAESKVRNPVVEWLEKQSNIVTARKIVGWMLRFCKNARLSEKSERNYLPSLDANEVKKADSVLVRLVQQDVFGDILSKMHSHDSLEGALGRGEIKVKAENHLLKLRPILLNDLLRVSGRLSHAPLDFEEKYPVILPGKHHYTTILVERTHVELIHPGANIVLCHLREQGYWIVNGISAIRRIVGSCFMCKRLHARPLTQLMSALPPCRVTPYQKCFYYCGTDLCGPFYVKVKRSQEKRWIVAFSCLSSRAVHLEVAGSLDTTSYLQALTRFTSNRAVIPNTIWSDNGTNMKSASKEIRELYKELDTEKITAEMATKGINWRFGPPAASHQNGATEIVFRQVRKCMRVLVGEAKLKCEAFRTVIAEIATTLNSRPLCTVSPDSTDLKVLTPNMLLGGTADVLPSVQYDTADTLRNAWKHGQNMANAFWTRWKREYLSTLNSRQKWLGVKRNLRKNDVVLIVDDTTKRNLWPLGIITDVFPDRDGHVRRVNVRKANGNILQRDVRKLCLLEAAI